MRKLSLCLFAAALLLFAACSAPPDGSGYEMKNEGVTEIYFTVNGNRLKASLAENPSVDALIDLLKENEITYTANDYGGFEKVGNIGHALPKNDERLTSEAGDIFLYQGNQICIFVGSNSYAYTRIGRIEGHTVSELKAILGTGAVQITISLE